MKKISISAAFLLSGILWSQITQDTINVNEVIISSNRFQTPISQENRNATVIKREEIEKIPAKSIQEILQYANGVDLRQRGVFGSQADVSIDGGSFEQTLVLLNGVKITDHQTAHNALNLPIPVEAIEQIEVIRGPGARIYGNNSLTGVINIITRKPKKSGFYANSYFGTNFEKNIEKESERYSARGIQIGGAYNTENQQHLLFLSHDKGNGYRYNTAFENNKIYLQNHFQLNENNEINSSFGYVNNGFGANGFYAAPGDKDSKEIIETFLGSIQSKHQISERFIIKPQISYRYNFDDYRYYKNDLSKARSKHYSNAFGSEINSTYELNKGILGFGLEYRHEQINSTAIGEHNRNNFGFYGEYKVDWTEKFNTNIGFYTNYNSKYDWQFFPGIDASYQLLKPLKIVANLGTSQRIPSFTDLYLDQRPGNIGNANVEPEKAFQAETGLKFYKNNFTLEGFYFYRKIDKFIDWVRLSTDEPWEANNFGNLETNGFNLRAKNKFLLNANQNINLSLSYSFLDSEFSQVDEEFASKYKIESLKHQLTNIIEYNANRFSVTMTNRFNERYAGDSYWITDARASYKFLDKKLTLYADAQNIFNTVYHEIGAIPLPSQWFTLGLKFINF